MRVLLIEDEPNTAKAIEMMLVADGFAVYTTDLGEEGLDLGMLYDYDLILLDLNLPDMHGYDVLKKLRASKVQTPVLVISGIGEMDSKIRSFGFGADDYVTKPFSPRELVARAKAVLRRVRPALAGEALRFGDVEMDTVAHKVKRGGKQVPLGPTEYRLLKHFLEYPGHVFSRERLLDSVWGHDSDIEIRTVDVHIRRLRKALNEGFDSDIIRTVRSAGYSLDQVAV
jgi:two-component system phosphate regulon response regulator PhoB